MPKSTSPCGTRARYIRGCRCGSCTEANRVYTYELRQRMKESGKAQKKRDRRAESVNRGVRQLVELLAFLDEV
jgi:Zn ribbon nucleic-acid-binding protein